MKMFEKNVIQSRSDRVCYQRNWKYDPGLWDILIQVMVQWNPALLVHSVRVANLAMKIALGLGLSHEEVELVIRASLYHDIGKLGISQKILAKPGPLTKREYELVKTYPELSAALLQECSDADMLVPILRHHHEFFNGKGYPDKISGEEIEIEARIVFVAEVVTSMISDSAYRRARPISRVICELRRYSGIRYDPLVVKATIRILQERKTNPGTV